MIVRINENNSDKYRQLFTEAYEFLEGLNNGSVTSGRGQFSSLAEYYGHIADLFDQQKYEYIMVPLDEEPFEINLNTRIITVPKSFSKCASVQTDVLAETIIFVSDRYFDYMDLANTEIYVQWTAPDGVKGATRVEMKDIESEPGKIKFAWPLNDAITKVPGVVKFAVRFFRIAEDMDNNDGTSKELVYSLNTLDAEIIIKAALQPEGPSKVEKPISENLFRRAIVNSNYSAVGVNPPVQPIYAEPGVDIAVLEEDKDGNDIIVPISNVTDEVVYIKVNNMTIEKFVAGKYFILVDNKYVKATEFNENETYFIEIMQGVKYVGLKNDTITLYVQAIAADTGEISYKWYYQAQDGKYNDKPYDCENYPEIGTFGTVNHETYIEVKNPQNVAHERYYEKKADGAYEEYTTRPIESGKTLYEKYSALTVPSSVGVTGLYHAAAWNTIHASGYVKVDNLTEDRFDTGEYYIKNNNGQYVAANSFNSKETYYMFVNESLTTKLPTESSDCLLPGPREIVISKDLADGAIFAAPEGSEDLIVKLDVEIKNDNYNPVISYDWRTSDVSEDNVFTNMDNAVNSIGNKNSYTVTEFIKNGLDDGWYGVAVTSELNRKKETKYSNIIKVTHKPKPPRLTFQEPEYVSVKEEPVTFKVVVDPEYLNINNKLLSDKIDYVWQMMIPDHTWTTVTGAEAGITIDENDKSAITIDNKFSYTFATFRCLVINELNGAKTIFDHSNDFIPENNKMGEFVKEPPYVYEDQKYFDFTVKNY